MAWTSSWKTFSVSYSESSDNNTLNLYIFSFCSPPLVILGYLWYWDINTQGKMILHISFYLKMDLKNRVFIINNSCVSDRIPAGSDTDKIKKSPTLNHKQNNRYEFQKHYHLSIMYYNLWCIIHHALSSKCYTLPNFRIHIHTKIIQRNYLHGIRPGLGFIWPPDLWNVGIYI